MLKKRIEQFAKKVLRGHKASSKDFIKYLRKKSWRRSSNI